MSVDLGARLGVRVVEHGTVDSTMAAALADCGEAPAVHLAESQTAGRGRHGRAWRSAPGNLHATFRWPEREGPFPPALLSAVQLAWARAIRDAGGPDARCLWPNDGMLGDAKWAGVLATRPAERPGELHLGLGANLVAAPGVEGRRTACLAPAWVGWPGESVVVPLLLDAALRVLAEGPGGVAARLGDWPRYDALGPGERLAVDAPGGRLEGRYAGIDAEGRLRLLVDSREHRLAIGDVRRVRPA